MMASDVQQDLASEIAKLALAQHVTVAAAESVTAGTVAAALASGQGGGDWFKGSIVAYQTSMKRDILGVTAGRVITEECASEMVQGACRLSNADIAVSTTGVGGPDPEERKPAGTVFIGIGNLSDSEVFEHHFEGDPAAVVSQAATIALQHLKRALESTA